METQWRKDIYKYIGYIKIKLPVTCMLQCSYFGQLQPPLSLKHSRITLQQPSKPGILQGSTKSKWNVKMQFVRIGRFASIVEELHLERSHQKVKKITGFPTKLYISLILGCLYWWKVVAFPIYRILVCFPLLGNLPTVSTLQDVIYQLLRAQTAAYSWVAWISQSSLQPEAGLQVTHPIPSPPRNGYAPGFSVSSPLCPVVGVCVRM